MSHTIYAAFSDPEHAHVAITDLLDAGIRADAMSLILKDEPPAGRFAPPVDALEYSTPQTFVGNDSAGLSSTPDPLGNDKRMMPFHIQADRVSESDIELHAPHDAHAESARKPDDEVQEHVHVHAMTNANLASEPTGPVAAEGESRLTASSVAKGAAAGAGVGALAAYATVAIPGFGLLIGGGALAAALVAMAASAGAGAVAGGIVGYLREHGVDAHDIPTYQSAYETGGALLAVGVEDEQRSHIEEILRRAGGENVKRYGYAA